jgi:hypothetical protein
VRLPVLLSFALLPAGCLVEYVLPADPATTSGDPPTETTGATTGAMTEGATGGATGGMTGDAEASGNTGATGDAPTGSDTSDAPQPCEGESQLRCDGACIDPSTNNSHCGGCDDPCKSDELCIVGECRDVLVLDCEGCPCADQCPEGEGVLASTTGDEADSGDVPAKYLCCDAVGETPAVCVLGDAEDVLVCPAG